MARTLALFATERRDRVAYAAAALAGLIAAIVLLGWLSGTAVLTGLLPGLPDMKLTAAVSIGLLSLALAAAASGHRRARYVALAATTIAVLIALAGLSAWLGGPGAVLDEFVVPDPQTAVAPGRIAPATALAFLLLAGTLVRVVLAPGHRPVGSERLERTSLALCLTVVALALLALVGLAFDAGAFYEPLVLRGMAPATALSVSSLAVGLAAMAMPTRTRDLVVSDGPGGVLLRRTLPLTLLALALIGYLALLGQRAGVYGRGMGAALTVIVTGSVLTLLLSATARQLDRQHASIRDQRFTQQLYQQILDQSPVAVFVKDEQGRYVVVNAATAESLGSSRDEVVGRTDRDLLPSHVADRLMATDQRVRATRSWVDEEERLTTDRGTRTFLSTKFPIESPGRPEILVGGISSDVTERQELEHRFAQMARLETVGELAGGIAHDFNNLLTVIRGMTELAIQDIGDHPARASLDHAVAAAGRAADLSRDLLTFARMDGGPHEGTCDPNLVVEELERLLRPLLSAGVTLRLETSDDVDDVPVTTTRLEQVMMNLALNARDAMGNGGELTISTHSVEVDDDLAKRLPHLQPGPHVRLTVEDTGTGMTPDVRDRALEPFFTTKTSGRGTGLGLSSAYGVVTGAGGAITIDSSPGRGTAVTVLLPSAEHRSPVFADEDLAGPPDVADEGRRLLVIEDEPAVREVMRRHLVAAGFAVTTADGAAEAIALSEHIEPPGLVICDVVLRDGVGPGLVEHLRERWAGVAVLYVSGYTEHGGGQLGPADRLLCKPFSAAALHRAVAASLKGAGSPAPVNGSSGRSVETDPRDARHERARR